MKGARWGVECDTDVLRDVLVGSPENYYWLPTSSVAKYSLSKGISFDRNLALRQHEDFCITLERAGARVFLAPPRDDLPDIPFTRDTTFMTPWGLLGLKMHVPERQPEVDHILSFAQSLDIPFLGRVSGGAVEGGDLCLLRRDLLVIGCSGERTTRQGAADVEALFRSRGFDVWTYTFESFFLHLDTFFGLISEDAALVCVDIVEDEFTDFLIRLGIRIIPVSYKEMRNLGANILSLGGGRVLSSARNARVNEAMREIGVDVFEADISSFTLGGGGIHCLTMPLSRGPA